MIIRNTMICTIGVVEFTLRLTESMFYNNQSIFQNFQIFFLFQLEVLLLRWWAVTLTDWRELLHLKTTPLNIWRKAERFRYPWKINAKNWLEVTQHYRRLFTLEIQFRRFYVDYFLKVLGEQKKFYAECECYRQGQRTGIADNAMKIGGRWCFVEVKLNIHTEPHLHNQLKKYCQVEKTALDKERSAEKEKLWQNSVLVIDTTDFYFYDALTDNLIFWKIWMRSAQRKILKLFGKRLFRCFNKQKETLCIVERPFLL